MPIISARVNENNRRKRKAKKPQQTNKYRKKQGGTGTEAIVKVWKLNDFVVHLS